MSAEEDADLRDLVAHTLENNGVLGRIKAELRAKVFMVLEAHDRNEANQLPVVNENLRNFMNTKEGRLVTGLVREFMEFFELDYSLAVFDPETNFGDRYQGREGLADELSVGNMANGSKPVLASLLENFPSGIPKLDLGSINEDKVKKGRVSPEISPRSLSSGSRNNSPRVSRIPQRVKDKKRDKSDMVYPKDMSSERLQEDDVKSGHQGNLDLSLSLNDDDILAEITQPRPGSSRDKTDNEVKKGFPLVKEKNSPSHEELWLHSSNNLGPLDGGGSLLSDLGVSSASPDLKQLAEIDRRMNELGFGIPAEDKTSSPGDDYNDSYADDFNASSHSNDDNSSIPEEIDGDPFSIASLKSEESKADDLITSDRTVSSMDKDFDFGEDVVNF